MSHHTINRIQQRIDNGIVPDDMSIGVADAMTPALVVRFDRREFVLNLGDATCVTDTPSALEDAAPCVLAEVEKRDGLMTDGFRLLFISEIDTEKEESASYTAVSEGFVNETHHPHQHLPYSHDGEEYFLFER